jgi:hypothetical protein
LLGETLWLLFGPRERQLNQVTQYWKPLGINAKYFCVCREKNAKTGNAGEMESSLRMLVYYHCPNPNCGMIYGATRERRTRPQTGAFACTICESEVLTWSDYYNFVDWLLMTKRPTKSERKSVVASG